MKYHREVVTDKTAKRSKELIREICHTWTIKIIRVHVDKDHVQIFVSFQPHQSVSKLIQHLKGMGGNDNEV